MRYHIYRIGGAYVGPAHNLHTAIAVIQSLYRHALPGEPVASLYRENRHGVPMLIGNYSRPYPEQGEDPVLVVKEGF